jgi:hypothetical protein
VKRIATVIALVLAGLGTYTGTASAATATATSPDQATCRAFATWERHSTPANLRHMVLDSDRADTYLRVDVGTLYQAIRHRARTAADIRYVRLDCGLGGDE